jgi:hypothetical protein
MPLFFSFLFLLFTPSTLMLSSAMHFLSFFLFFLFSFLSTNTRFKMSFYTRSLLQEAGKVIHLADRDALGPQNGIGRLQVEVKVGDGLLKDGGLSGELQVERLDCETARIKNNGQ